MSIRVRRKVDRIELAKATQKAVASTLADHAWHDGTKVFPSVKTICRHTGFSERAVQDALRDLEELGLIVLVHRGGGAECDTNGYRFDMKLLQEMHEKAVAKWKAEDDAARAMRGKRGAPRAPHLPAKGGAPHSKGSALHSKGGAPPAPNPSIDPSLNQEIAPSVPQREKQPRVKTELPGDWKLSPELRLWAIGRRPALADMVGDQAEIFRDHYLATGREKADWVAAWRAWWMRVVRPREHQGDWRSPSARAQRDAEFLRLSREWSAEAMQGATAGDNA